MSANQIGDKDPEKEVATVSAAQIAVIESRLSKVEERLSEGVDKFKLLETGQNTVLSRIEENTQITRRQSAQMAAHVQAYDDFAKKVEPAIVAVEAMRRGVEVIGKIGDFVAWCGKWARRIIIFVGGIAGGIYAIVQFLKEFKK